MAYRHNSAVTVMVGVQKAADLLKLNRFPGQRPINRDTVKRYMNAMKSGHFVKGQIALALHDGITVLMNGQHQLTAIVDSGTAVKCTIDEYVCDENEDVWKLFGTFDVGRQRTELHMVHAARGLFECEALRLMPYNVLASCASALWQIQEEPPQIQVAAPTKTSKVELLEKHTEEVIWFSSLFASCALNHLPHIPVVASAIRSYRANKAEAQAFWFSVFSSSDLKKGSAEWRLNRALSIDGRKRSGGRRHCFELMCLCACWWNSYMDNDDRSSVKLAVMNEVPILRRIKKAR